MDLTPSPRSAELAERLGAFMEEFVYPLEPEIVEATREPNWEAHPQVEGLKARVRREGLWNLFLPSRPDGGGLSNLDYAPLCEIMGKVAFASEIFNCSAPDTGNMEILERYGTPEQKARWLDPLLAGEIRSCFAMTEPDVASSDATNIQCRVDRDGPDYVINGRKWWSTGAMSPRCRLIIVMAKTDPDGPDRHRQQSMILVPFDTRGVEIVRWLPSFGYSDAPRGHAELRLTDVRVPAENVLLGEGRGFEIAQGRLGPGRIHHCMRLIGVAERALEIMCRRALSRSTFGKRLSDQGVTRERIAESRVLIEQARLLTLKAARMMDTVGNKAARAEIAMIKVAGPAMACKVTDWAIQACGGAGVSDDFFLARAYATARVLRIADGPDEVHRDQLARMELGKYRQPAAGQPERS